MSRRVLWATAIVVLCLGGVWLVTSRRGRSRVVDDSPCAPSRVLLIGVDGLDWERADALVSAGRMPNLGRLIGNGTSGVLRSIAPYASPTVWTSIATGKTAERHGVGELGMYGARGGDAELAGSLAIECMTLWEILAAAGRTSGIVGWFVTYPPVPVTSYTVTFRAIVGMSGGGAPAGSEVGRSGLASAVYPRELWEEMAGLGVAPADIPEEDILAYLVTPDYADDEGVKARTDNIARWLAADRTTIAAARHLMTRRPTDLAAVYIRGNDILSHFFWRYMEPDSWARGSLRPELVETFSSVIDKYYERVDAFLGELSESMDDSTAVVVCSDHGFAGHRGHPGFRGDVAIGIDMHRAEGVVILEGPGISRGKRIEGAGVLDITPTVLALLGVPVGRDMDGVPLVSAFEPSLLEARPITYVDTYEMGDRMTPGGTAESPVDDEIRELLKSLGYIN